MQRRAVMGGILSITLLAGGGQLAGGAPGELDRPGEEVILEEPQISVLDPLLPPFEATLIDGDPDAEGWGPLRLSPSGRYLLAEVRARGRRTVLLLDASGKLLRDLSHESAPVYGAAWGATDQQLLLDSRSEPGARARLFSHNPTTGTTVPVAEGGLGEWAPGGRVYLLALSTINRPRGQDETPSGFQRYSAAHTPIGKPLVADEPVWSGDGQWLAFLTSSGREPEAASWDELREVRVLPARGDIPRVVIARSGWERVAKEQHWQQARGPEGLVWDPSGETLYGFCDARADGNKQRFLVRFDIRSPRREVLAVPPHTTLISASADARHWIVRLGNRLYRLDFKAPPSKRRTPVPGSS